MSASGAGAVDIKVVDQDDRSITYAITGAVVAHDGLKVRSAIGPAVGSKAITVQLAMAGGVRLEAMSIGRFFQRAKIRTVIASKSRCISPCPLTLVGGRDPDTGKASYIKYSSASLGFSSVVPNYADKDYTLADLDGAVASTQRGILQVADYLRDVHANINLLRNYQSVLKKTEIKYISNEEALDLGIAVMFEDTGQLIEPLQLRP